MDENIIGDTEFEQMNEKGKDYQFLFSVIVPIYNTEQYLEETLESIVNQTIGFQENIQLILVNNASEDHSANICKRYMTMYPDNVIYIKLEKNQGPSGARNAGMHYIRGKYVNFLDSDDKWELSTFKKVFSFFEKNIQEIDCVACRQCFFDAGFGDHPLNFRFKKDMIVDVNVQYKFLQLHVNSVFFFSDAICNIRFDEKMDHAEDTKFFNTVMLSKNKYGVIKSGTYYYRKRAQSDSLLNHVQKEEDYFTSKIRDSLGYFIQYSIRNFGEVIPYVQNMIIYSLKYRIKEGSKGEVSLNTINTAFSLMSDYLRYVSIEIILEQDNVYKEHKIFALSLKQRCDVRKYIYHESGSFYYRGSELFNNESRSNCALINLELKNDKLCLNGRINLPLLKKLYHIYVRTNTGAEYPLSYYELDHTANRYFLGILYHEIRGFTVEIPLDNLENLEFVLEYEGEKIVLALGFWLVTKLSTKLQNTYCILGNYIVRYKNCKLLVTPKTIMGRTINEVRLCRELLRDRHIKTLLWRILIQCEQFKKHLLKKKLWLFLDTFSTAGDNAEYLFRYVVEHVDQSIVPVFCVEKNSPFYDKLKLVGKVIPFDTKRYRLAFAVCDNLISSQTFYGVQNTFYQRTEYLKDLFKFKFVYLQHGVIKDNHADTQSKHKKAVDLFVTTGIPEYNSLLHDFYGYDESVVKLTGLARYDGIYQVMNERKEKKSILLAPTWRKLANQVWDESSQRYKYNSTFVSSNFYRFYNGLITDERILSVLKEKGYVLVFQLHPRIWEQNVDFCESELVHIQRNKIALEDAISSTSLLITDYSSIFFDYAYADIPVIYTQFDKKKFYANHSYTRGYFDYEHDGFGPVCYDYESTVQAIIKAIEHGCVMDEMYKNRVNQFFAYRDGNNCERIYNEILKLDTL